MCHLNFNFEISLSMVWVGGSALYSMYTYDMISAWCACVKKQWRVRWDVRSVSRQLYTNYTKKFWWEIENYGMLIKILKLCVITT